MVRWIHSSIMVKMTLLVLVGTAVVFSGILIYSYVHSKGMILQETELSATNLAKAMANRIDREFRGVEKAPRNLACVLENVRYDEKTLLNIMRRMVESNAEIFGMAVAYEPYAFDVTVRNYAPYFCKKSGAVEYVQLATSENSYFQQDWYHIPKEVKAPVWSEPYFDEGGGNILMATYSFPLFQVTEEGKPSFVKAIVTADVSLEWLTKFVSSMSVGRTGYGFLISDNGTFVTHPRTELIMRESMFSLAEELHKPNLREIGHGMIGSKSGFVDLGMDLAGHDAFLAFARIPSTGWSLGAVIPKEELFAGVTQLHLTTEILGLLGVALLLVVSLVVARSIASPLRRMAAATSKVARGDLDVELPDARRQDEVGQLAMAFGRMTQDLKQYIRDLTEATAAKERIESELSIAAQIQKSMLPSVFPAFPERDEFDIYAIMRPAKEVGGDFYDFFLLDDHRLCVVVGDVSGKGVPAALFMAVTKYLVEASGGEGNPPNEILRLVNSHLIRNNDSCMFVTVFVGILNLQTGEFVYANGGHNPPLVLVAGGEPTFLEPPGGPVLGVMEGATFRMDRCVLSPGTTLLAYTDGVTEAFDKNGEAFSDERLLAAVSSLGQRSAKDITETLTTKIDEFCGGAPQADDITVLCLMFKHTSHRN